MVIPIDITHQLRGCPKTYNIFIETNGSVEVIIKKKVISDNNSSPDQTVMRETSDEKHNDN